MIIEFSQINGLQVHQLLGASVVPRPIAWISTLGKDGVSNLAPYSFFTVASCQPPVLSVTHINSRAALKMAAVKDTLANLKETSECVVNFVLESQLSQAIRTSGDYPRDVDEFELSNLEKIESTHVKPYGVVGVPFRYECRLRELFPLSSEPAGGTLILLDVICIHCDEHYLTEEKHIKANEVQLIGKLGNAKGGDFYSKINSDFSIERPPAKH